MTVLTTHTHHWLFTCGGAGHGNPEEDLASSLDGITRFLDTCGVPATTALVRLDGQFGSPVLLRLLGQAPRCCVTRSIGSPLLQLPSVQAHLAVPPTAQVSGLSPDQPFALFDVGERDRDEQGLRVRVIVFRRTAPRGRGRLSVGQRQGTWVSERFLTTVPATRVRAQDVLDLSRGRGGCENDVAADDQDTDPDRWCSHSRLWARVLAHPGSMVI